MPDQPQVSLTMPQYSILRKNGRLAIGGGKAMLWSSVPRVAAFLELFKDQCDNFVIIDTHDRLRDFVAKAHAGGLTHVQAHLATGRSR